MKEKKEKCKHPKIPSYELEEQEAANTLIDQINRGDVVAYGSLCRLAVSVVRDGRFYRETCEKCHGLSSSTENSEES